MRLANDMTLGVTNVAAAAERPDASRWAFAGVFVFTLLLYVRPNELAPSVFGSLPIAKAAAVATVALFVVTGLASGRPLTIWPLELKALVVMTLVAVLTIPFAVAPGDSIAVLKDNFLKAAIMCLVIMNVAGTPWRLRTLLRLVVLCGVMLALFAVRDFEAGFFPTLNAGEGVRIAGIVNGMFGNPNDLATSLSQLVPLAVGLAVTRRGLVRALFLACAALLTLAVVVSFSRGGFLSLVAMGGLLMWKLRRRHRGAVLVACGLALVAVVTIAPSGYGDRLSTIFDISADKTGSAQERYELMQRAASVAATRPIVGVGIGNFHVYSIREYVAHNSYLEVAAELGWIGFVAYLLLIVGPLVSLNRIERATREEPGREEVHVTSMTLQAAFVSYAVCSFFTSIEYQWHIYYLVGYAVALRTIHTNAGAASGAAGTDAPAPSRSSGVLWANRPAAGVS